MPGVLWEDVWKKCQGVHFSLDLSGRSCGALKLEAKEVINKDAASGQAWPTGPRCVLPGCYGAWGSRCGSASVTGRWPSFPDSRGTESKVSIPRCSKEEAGREGGAAENRAGGLGGWGAVQARWCPLKVCLNQSVRRVCPGVWKCWVFTARWLAVLPTRPVEESVCVCRPLPLMHTSWLCLQPPPRTPLLWSQAPGGGPAGFPRAQTLSGKP